MKTKKEMEEPVKISHIDDLSFDVKKGAEFIVVYKELKKFANTLTEKQDEEMKLKFYREDLTGGYCKLVRK